MKQQVFQGCASGRNDGAVAFQGIGAFIGGGIDNIPDVCPVYHSFSGSEVIIVDTHVVVKVNRKQSVLIAPRQFIGRLAPYEIMTVVIAQSQHGGCNRIQYRGKRSI